MGGERSGARAAGSYFERTGPDTYAPTSHTQGPWNPEHQHAGPTVALTTRAVEHCLATSGGDPLDVGRITCEILAPLTLAPMTVRARLERPGKRVRLVRAELGQRGRTVLTASAWAVAHAPGDLPVRSAPAAVPHRPPEGLPSVDPTRRPEWDCGFMASVEWRFADGGFGRPGPAAVWARPRIPLLAGEAVSPLQRLLLTADSANGVSAELPIDRWLSISPELTVHVARLPRGPWLCLDAETSAGPGETGLATGRLWDGEGLVARSAQCLLLAPQSR
ncbi:hypothetical protein BLA24_32070 [Streptomyces cinnamoneus]|uniref:Uncharacterized protein n=1 Tax=Streptomyces cinnamoneus TaxID=53446 RepID=A0A2G1XA36_STRCJ|nr:thioesterase family protein [Streptomyces cinnamoneus]PHQ48082.1 hypothetical protein BLA24_32070 [Streptomyces cinnamoneus]PPT15708.1 thioesterase family protein [Streptomyces cinnamoneus]